MKTYILRPFKTVEPQNPRRNEPVVAAVVEAMLGPAPAVPHGPVLFIGLDVHNDSIAVSLAASDAAEMRRYGIIGGSHDEVLRLIKKLSSAHPGVALRFCYEAGPRGYPLCRFIRGHGAQCLIVLPSKAPRKPGDRVKTDRRDADQLARLYRAGGTGGQETTPTSLACVSSRGAPVGQPGQIQHAEKPKKDRRYAPRSKD